MVRIWRPNELDFEDGTTVYRCDPLCDGSGWGAAEPAVRPVPAVQGRGYPGTICAFSKENQERNCHWVAVWDQPSLDARGP